MRESNKSNKTAITDILHVSSGGQGTRGNDLGPADENNYGMKRLHLFSHFSLVKYFFIVGYCMFFIPDTMAETGTIAGIVSAIGMALVGAVSGYISYQKKKLCFSIQRKSLF